MKRSLSIVALFIALLLAAVLYSDLNGGRVTPDRIVKPEQGSQSSPTELASEIDLPHAHSDYVAALPPTRLAAPAGMTMGALRTQHPKLLNYFHRMLRDAGRPPIPDGARIDVAEVETLLKAIQSSQDQLKECDRTWNRAVSERVDLAIAEIKSAILAGETPSHRLQGRGPSPKKPGQFDKVALHRPSGSSDSYVIELPESCFPKEVGAYRDALQMQADLFDHALRQLFCN